MNEAYFDKMMAILESFLNDTGHPAVTEVAERSNDPFKVLIATIISLRTKDEITRKVSTLLFEQAKNAKELAELDVETISEIIKPANFYRTKAKRIKEIARKIVYEYGGVVPSDLDTLLSMKGVGRKTANLVITEGFGLPGICVDTHVHRILNRLGIIRTKNPKDTEFKLREVLPQRYWIRINTFLVLFGQRVCRPISPHCSICPLDHMCEKIGVTKKR